MITFSLTDSDQGEKPKIHGLLPLNASTKGFSRMEMLSIPR
jgi:hypothetical protein